MASYSLVTQRIGPHGLTIRTYVRTWLQDSEQILFKGDRGLSSRRTCSLLGRYVMLLRELPLYGSKSTYVHVNSKRTDLSYSFMYSEDEVTVRDFYLYRVHNGYPTVLRVYVRAFVSNAGFPIPRCRSVASLPSTVPWNSLRRDNTKFFHLLVSLSFMSKLHLPGKLQENIFFSSTLLKLAAGFLSL